MTSSGGESSDSGLGYSRYQSRRQRSRTPTAPRAPQQSQESIVGGILSEVRAAAARAAASQHAPLLTGAGSSARPGTGGESPAPRPNREELDESILQDMRRIGDRSEDARHLNRTGAASQAAPSPTSNTMLRHERAQADRATWNSPLGRPAQTQATGESGRRQSAGTILNRGPPSQLPNGSGPGQLTGSQLSRPAPVRREGQGDQGQPGVGIEFRPYSAARAGQGVQEQPPGGTSVRNLPDQSGQRQPLGTAAPSPIPPWPTGEGVQWPSLPVIRPAGRETHIDSKGQQPNIDPTRPSLIRLSPQDMPRPWLSTIPSAPFQVLPAEQDGRGPPSSTTLSHLTQTQMTAEGGRGLHSRNNPRGLIRTVGSQPRAVTEEHSPSAAALDPTSMRSGASGRDGSGANRSPGGRSGAGHPGAGPSRLIASPSVVGPSAASASEKNSMLLRIETRLFLRARNSQQERRNVVDFVHVLADNHNRQVSQRHARIASRIRSEITQEDDKEWCFRTVEGIQDQDLGWFLELATPVFEIVPRSQWRNDVEETWKYLRQHYRITSDEIKSSTHIHVSLVNDYSLLNLRQVGLYAIHLETAIEALLPQNRRGVPTPDGPVGLRMGGHPDAESNWLASPFLAQHGKSRYASMIAINEASDVDAVVRLMNGTPDGHDPPNARNYAWNFKSSLRGRRAIEFRKPPASLEAATFLSWAELTMTFIQASVIGGDPAWATHYPANLRGLTNFLHRANISMVSRPDLWQKLFVGKEPRNAAREPAPCLRGGETSLVMQTRLNRLLEDDKRQLSKRRRQE